MDWLIWTGTALTLVGLAGLIWVIATAMRVRRSGLDDAATRARLQKLVAVNLGSLALASIGLMCVIVGIAL